MVIITHSIDAATAELVADIKHLLDCDVPEDVRAQAIYEAHADITNEQYQLAWVHLDAPTRRKWKEYVDAERWRLELHGDVK